MHPLKRPKIDLTGLRVGRLLVISYSESNDGRKAWVCHCDCGTKVDIRGVNLRSGKTKSCGCFKADRMAEGLGKKHGMHLTRTYKTWHSMLERCRNPSATSYKDYGGRGITVCREWYQFERFYSDMGERPDGMTLDRIENSRGYEPGNCKWSTPSEQQNNRRNNVTYLIGDREFTSLQLSEICGANYHTIRRKIRHAADVMEVLFKHGIESESHFWELAKTKGIGL